MMSSTASAPRLRARASSQACESGWYALYTYPRHEKRIAEQIESRRFCCFLPLYRSVRRWKDRRKEIDQVLFPGYVFVHMALEDKLKVLQLPGVVRLVTSKGRPVPVSADEIETLRDRLSRSSKLEPHPYLRTGRRVRVRRGPLEGLEGVIVRRKESWRFVFSIDLIQRSVAVEIDEADLEAT
jgi:transcription antitermination factor NusG